ncbi:Hypothetical protein ETEE_3342 [Edwardsiella anguillarum ET080813]|uniref:Uncharacterized protein n=1 Tax=Edwardsiella anguillarum ET080813 TaxID=667120 RepID=A0A076LWA1_9GAMM|nr:Hypothetical protein ETEE_3342 [Edwardsiella anguillarum ET080813]
MRRCLRLIAAFYEPALFQAIGLRALVGAQGRREPSDSFPLIFLNIFVCVICNALILF